MNIYVGNLSPMTTEPELRNAFGKFGDVGRISMPQSKPNSEIYLCAFVEMPTHAHASSAIVNMHGATLDGRLLTVAESGMKVM